MEAYPRDLSHLQSLQDSIALPCAQLVCPNHVPWLLTDVKPIWVANLEESKSLDGFFCRIEGNW
jgi:hypothetical protein